MEFLVETDDIINKVKVININEYCQSKKIQSLSVFSFPDKQSTIKTCQISKSKLSKLLSYINKTQTNGAIIFFGDNEILSKVCYIAQEEYNWNYQTWIAIRTSIQKEENRLPNEHKGALIFTLREARFNINKMRFPYTYCPACNKTTKDYGGKKHLFHEYGTTISDVWKHIVIDRCDKVPDDIVKSFKHLFAGESFKRMNWVEVDENDIFTSENHSFDVQGELINNIKHLTNKILNGDVLDKLKQIPSNSIDYIFVDPPYNLKKKYKGYHDNLEIADYLDWCDSWLNELVRVLKPGRFLTILNIPIWVSRHHAFLSQYMEYSSWIVWDALSRPAGKIMPANYVILTMRKPAEQSSFKINLELDNSNKPSADNYCLRSSCIRKRAIEYKELTDLWTDIHRLKHNSRRLNHPTQLPPKLLNRLIEIYSNENEIVLDSFNGIGTTTLCAHGLNRKYIGIEIEKNYAELANNRHKEISEGIDPFRKNDISAKEKVKNNEEERHKSLKKSNSKYTKKTIQLQIKNLYKKLGTIPTKQQAVEMLDIPEEVYDEYFKSWYEVTAAARTTGMKETR